MSALATEAAALSTQTQYSFINLLDPGDSSLPSQRKAVRSHAASYQHSHVKKISPSHSSKKKRPRKPKPVALVPGESIISILTQSLSSYSKGSSHGTLEQLTHRFTANPKPSLLGQGRVDPFRTYPVPWEPFIPGLVDHCSYIVSSLQNPSVFFI
jgi:hypothetical protein